MKFTHSEQKLTEQELADFEKEFKIKLPPSYKKVIMDYNGRFPEKEYFEGGMFLPIKYGEWNMEEAMDSDRILKNYLPFADYEEGSLCINLNNGNDYGKIYFIDESGEV